MHYVSSIHMYIQQVRQVIGVQVHNDLKTKNILLSDGFDVAKIGAHKDLPLPALAASK